MMGQSAAAAGALAAPQLAAARAATLALQPFVIVGGGRVGQALADMGAGADVMVRRGEAVPAGAPPGPIVVCTRNDDLQGVVDATPSERRKGAWHAQRSLHAGGRSVQASLRRLQLPSGRQGMPSHGLPLGIPRHPLVLSRPASCAAPQTWFSFKMACCSRGSTSGGWATSLRWAPLLLPEF